MLYFSIPKIYIFEIYFVYVWCTFGRFMNYWWVSLDQICLEQTLLATVLKDSNNKFSIQIDRRNQRSSIAGVLQQWFDSRNWIIIKCINNYCSHCIGFFQMNIINFSIYSCSLLRRYWRIKIFFFFHIFFVV